MTMKCSIELLQSALAGDLPADSETLLAEHLETCPACAARLDELAGGDQLCREAATLLAEDDLDASVPIGEGWSEIDFVVEHLEPADEPGILGRLGGYDILEVVGRGGMGVVLKGFDRSLKRCVAIKVLAPHLAQSSLARQRFAREAQAAAAVVHPHVLAIHQVQPQGRLPFLVMPLVAGQSLAERLAAQGTLELREILRVAMQAAAGLAAAHEQGLVHRDVKPANILLETGVERAVLTDFGLARAADDVSLTRQGIIAGTPEYMSPEQARGEPLDGRSDLFSLGSVIYEMASGVSPFRTDSTVATIRRLVDEAPRALESRNPELPPWFTSIVDRLLRKNPADRFASAKELSQLLEGCLAHVQQPANVPLPAGLPRARLRFSFRRPAFRRPSKRVVRGVLAMVAAFAATLLGLALLSSDIPDISGRWSGDDWGAVVLTKTSGGAYTGTYSETSGKQPGELEVKWSKVERRFNGSWREGQDRFGQISLRLAGDEIRGAYTTDTKSKLNPGTPALADLLWSRTDRPPGGLAQSGRQPTDALPNPADHVRENAPQPFYAPPRQSPDWTVTDSTARRDAARAAVPAAPELTIPLRRAATRIAYSPDGRLLAVAEWGGVARVYDAQTGESISTLGLTGDEPVKLFGQPQTYCGPALAFSADSKLIAVGQGGRWITVFDVRSAKQVLQIEHWGATELAFSPDGSLLASGGPSRLEMPRDGQESRGARVGGEVWDAETGLTLLLAVEGTLKLWDAKTGKLKSKIGDKDERDVWGIAFSPDGQLLASASQRRWGIGSGDEQKAAALEFWNTSTGKRVEHKDYGNARPMRLAFSPDGSRLAIGLGGPNSGSDGDRSQSGEIVVRYLADHHDELISTEWMPGPLAFAPDSRRVGYFCGPQDFRWKDSLRGEWVDAAVLPARGEDDGSEHFALAPDGLHVAISGLDDGKQAVRIWSLAGGGAEADAVLDQFSEAAPDASAPRVPTPTPFFELRAREPVKVLAYSPDGNLLGMAGDRANVYDFRTGKTLTMALLSDEEKASLDKPASRPATLHDTLISLAFSPDSRRVAVAKAGWIKLFDAHSGEQLLRIENLGVSAIAFSPDGKQLAAGSVSYPFSPDGNADGKFGAIEWTLRLWDAKTGEMQRQQNGASVTALAFSPDGERLASAGEAGVVVDRADSGAQINAFPIKGAAFRSIAFSPQGDKLLLGGEKKGLGWIELIDAATGNVEWETARELPAPVAFSPDGRQVGCLDLPQRFVLWDTVSGKAAGHIERPERKKVERWECFAFSPDGKHVAIGGIVGGTQGVRIWNLGGSPVSGNATSAGAAQPHAEGGEFGGMLPGGMGGMGGGLPGGIGFGGQVVLTGSLKPHRPASPTPPPALKIPTDQPAKAVAYSPDGKWLAIAGDQGMARLYDAASGKLALELALLSDEDKAKLRRDHTKPEALLETLWVTGVAFSPDSKSVALGTNIGQLKLFEVESGKLLRTFVDSRGWVGVGGRAPLELAHAAVRGIAFSPAGSELVSRSDGEMGTTGGGGIARRGTLKLWDAKTGELKYDLKEKNLGGDVSAIAFSPDGALASAGTWMSGWAVNTGVEFWDLKTGKRTKTFQLPREGSGQGGLPSAVSLAFEPGIFDDANPSSEGVSRLAIGMAGASGSRVPVEHSEATKNAEPSAAEQAFIKAYSEARMVTFDQILLIDPMTDEIEQRFSGWLGYHMAYSPDGKFLGVYEKPRQFALLDATTGEPAHVIELPEELSNLAWSGFAFAPDSQRVAIITVADGQPGVWVWDVASMPAAAEAEGEAVAAEELPAEAPANAAAVEDDRAVVALVTSTQDKTPRMLNNRLDLTLARPRYVLLGLAQYIDLTTKATSELPELGFYFVSPEQAADSRAEIAWDFYERDPVEGDLFLQLKGETGGRVAFDNSYRVGGKKPGKTILGPIGADPVATRWRAIQPTGPAFQITAGQASLTRPVWQTLMIFEAINVNNAVLGSIQLKLRACPILPGAQIADTNPTLKNGDWMHDAYLAQLIGPVGPQETAEPEKAGSDQAAAAIPDGNIHPDAPATSIAFSPDDKLVAVGCGRDTIGLYQATYGKPIGNIKFFSAEEEAVLASIVASGGPPHYIQATKVSHVAFSPDASLLAVADSIGQVKLFDVQNGKLVHALDGVDRKTERDKPLKEFLKLPLAQGNVEGIAFSPDGTLLATCGTAIDYALDGQDHAPDNTAGLLKLWDIKTGELKHDLAGGHNLNVRDVAFSADGKRLASLGYWRSTNGWQFGVKFWDPRTANVEGVLVTVPNLNGFGNTHWSLALSPDGKQVAIGAGHYDRRNEINAGEIQLYSLASGKLERSWPVQPAIDQVAYSFDGKLLAARSGESTLTLWDPSTGQPRHIANAELSGQRVMTWWAAPDDLAGDQKNLPSPIYPSTGVELNTFALGSKTNRAALGAIDAQGRGIVLLWDFGHKPADELPGLPPLKNASVEPAHGPAAAMSVKPVLEIHPEAAGPVAYSRDGKLIAVGGSRGAVVIYDAHSGEPTTTIPPVDEKEEMIVFSYLQSVMGGSMGGGTGIGVNANVYALAFSPDSTRLAVGNGAGQVKLFDAHSGKFELAIGDVITNPKVEVPEELRPMMRFAHARVSGIAFSPDGKLLATSGLPAFNFGSENQGVSAPLRLWDAKTGKARPGFRGEHNSFVWDIAFSRDGKLLASTGDWAVESTMIRGVKLRDPTTGEVVKAMRIFVGNVPDQPLSVSFSPDGSRLAVGLTVYDRTRDVTNGGVQVFDVASGRAVFTSTVPRTYTKAAYSADGKLLAALSGTARITFWHTDRQMASGELTPPDPDADEQWNALAFDPSGPRLAIAGLDAEKRGLVRVWDLGAAPTAGGEKPSEKSE